MKDRNKLVEKKKHFRIPTIPRAIPSQHFFYFFLFFSLEGFQELKASLTSQSHGRPAGWQSAGGIHCHTMCPYVGSAEGLKFTSTELLHITCGTLNININFNEGSKIGIKRTYIPKTHKTGDVLCIHAWARFARLVVCWTCSLHQRSLKAGRFLSFKKDKNAK